MPWPNPQDADSFNAVFDVTMPTTPAATQAGLSLFSNDVAPASSRSTTPPVTPDAQSVPEAAKEPLPPVIAVSAGQQVVLTAEEAPTVTQEPEFKPDGNTAVQAELSPADALFAAVRKVMQQLLKAPMKDVEVADALGVSTAQAKAWLQRLIEEDLIEKQKKRASYVVKQHSLFEYER